MISKFGLPKKFNSTYNVEADHKMPMVLACEGDIQIANVFNKKIIERNMLTFSMKSHTYHANIFVILMNYHDSLYIQWSAPRLTCEDESKMTTTKNEKQEKQMKQTEPIWSKICLNDFAVIRYNNKNNILKADKEEINRTIASSNRNE